MVGAVAADRAVGIATHVHLVERRAERVEEEQPAGERLAASEDQLERLVRLERADDPRQDAEDAALGAARRELGRRRLGEEAAVAGPLAGREDRRLALEAEDRAVDDRDPVPDGGVVHEVARREVVRAVDDHVPALAEDAIDVLGGQALLEGLDANVRVQRLDRALRREHLRLAQACRSSGRSGAGGSTRRRRRASTIPSVPTPAAAR